MITPHEAHGRQWRLTDLYGYGENLKGQHTSIRRYPKRGSLTALGSSYSKGLECVPDH